jgi:hypothetical protein
VPDFGTLQEMIVDVYAGFVQSDQCPASYIPIEVNPTFNFGFSAGRGVGVLRVGMREHWDLHLLTGIALDVLDVQGALKWVNERNRESSLGWYYCGILPDNSACAVVYANVMNSRIIDIRSDAIRSYIASLINLMARTAAEEPEGFISQHGGRHLTPADLNTLILMSL